MSTLPVNKAGLKDDGVPSLCAHSFHLDADKGRVEAMPHSATSFYYMSYDIQKLQKTSPFEISFARVCPISISP